MPILDDALVADAPSERQPAPSRAATVLDRAANAGVAADLLADEVTEGQVIAREEAPRPTVVSETGGAEPRLGQLLAGRYRLERLIARGGMGRVYLATQLPLGRKVAVKLLAAQNEDPEFRRRFFLEASTCARLVHRHIVTVHDYGEAEGELFMAMEYLDGEPLSKVLGQEIRLSSERVCQIALQVCRALRTAHKTGIVHRDLKPGNIMLLRDEDHDGQGDLVKVLDFGLVKVFSDQEGESEVADLTRSGTWLGSPRYMAPEQIRCKEVDPRTDIYSLGVIMFHMVAGRPPYVGKSSVEILEQHLRDPMPPIRDVVGELDYAPELEVIIARCMEKAAEDRYQSMDEVIADLKAAHRLITGVSVHTESALPVFADLDLSHETPSARTQAQPLSSPRDSGSFAPVRGPRRPATPAIVSSAAVPASAPPVMPMDTSLSEPPSMVTPARSGRRGVLLAVVLAAALGVSFAVTRALAPSRPAAPADRGVEISLTSAPSGAEVLIEGRLVGTTPLVKRLGQSAAGTTATLVVRKPGYEDTTIIAELDRQEVAIHASLRRSEPVPEVAPEPVPAVLAPPDPPLVPRLEPAVAARKPTAAPARPAAKKPEPSRPEAAVPAAKEPVERARTVDDGPRSLTVDSVETRRTVVTDSVTPVVD